SALLAARVARRVGLLNTMVVTHLPSNVLLILVPLMPNLPLAVAVLLLRFSISQMDVPTRQSYTVAVVGPRQRSAGAGGDRGGAAGGRCLCARRGAPRGAAPGVGGRPFLPGGRVQDRLRLAPLRAVRRGPPAGGGRPLRRRAHTPRRR